MLPDLKNPRTYFPILWAALVSVAALSSDAGEIAELSDATRANCLKVLRDGMQSGEFWPAIHAAEGLTLGGYGDEVLSELSPKLTQENDDQRRCGLARELIRAGDRSYVRIMLDILGGENDHGHVHAAESLYKVREIGDGSAMRKAYSQTANPILRLMAAGALARSGNAEALVTIREALTHDDSSTYRIAAWILGRIGDDSDIPRIRANLDRAPDDLTRAYHQHALAALGDAAGLKTLAENLIADDPALRVYAATFAGDARATSLVDQLESLLDDEILDVRIRAAQSLLMLSRPPADYGQRPMSASNDLMVGQAASDGVLRVPLLPPSKDNPRNSEGDVIELKDGRLLLVYTHFTGGASDHAKAYLAGRVSHDGGKSWSKTDIPVLSNEAGRNIMSVSLLRLSDGQIALFYLRKDSLEDCRPFLRLSDDEAMSWSEPKAVIPDTEIGYYVMNNDRVARLQNGRLLAPVAQHYGIGQEKWTGHGRILCYYSDDDGRTWHRGKTAPTPSAKSGSVMMQEPGVVELQDGRVMLFCRTDGGSQYVATSRDGGMSWSRLEASSIVSPRSPATIERIPATGDLLLVWNDHSNIDASLRNKRTPFVAAISRDDGGTWQTFGILEDNPHGWFCYTAMDFVDGHVVLAHCAGDRRQNNGLAETHITRFPIRWLYETSSADD